MGSGSGFPRKAAQRVAQEACLLVLEDESRSRLQSALARR